MARARRQAPWMMQMLPQFLTAAKSFRRAASAVR